MFLVLSAIKVCRNFKGRNK